MGAKQVLDKPNGVERVSRFRLGISILFKLLTKDTALYIYANKSFFFYSILENVHYWCLRFRINHILCD